MKNLKEYKLKEFLQLCNYTRPEAMFMLLSDNSKPEKLCGKTAPADLNTLTYGQRIEIVTKQDLFFTIPRVLMGLSEKQLLKENAGKIVGFNMFVIRDLEARAQRDLELSITPEKEEIEAGIMQINHGYFGVIDSLARRMGVKHEEVEKMSDNMVYAMLKIDSDSARYAKRYREVVNRNKK